jgi:hypothetical protein
MSKVLYHNDGKQKWQSHEIYSKELENHFDVFLQGYGASKEEAYSEFIGKLDEYIEQLHNFRIEISIENTVNVDCLGNPT